MAVQASASQTIDGYNIIATYSASTGTIVYTVNKPDGSELFRAGSSFGLTGGFSNLARRAEEEGNTELANTYRSINSQASSVVPVLDTEVQDQLKAVQPPPPSEPVPPATENTPNPNPAGNSPANDDSQYDPKTAAENASKANLPTITGSNEMETLNESYAGKTQAGSSNTTSTDPIKKNVGVDPKPGTRLKNPLGNFSSYTYQLSLYMITPDAHSKFVATGRKDISQFAKAGANAGAYLILQSGGINNTLSQRPANMPYDYYIDDLRITNVVSTKQTATSSNITKITFNIIEPVGFSFTTKLKRAREALMKTSKIPNIEKATNASKQFFVLGIRFQGYDVNGEIANASKYFSDDTFNASPDASGVYERFYDILFEKVSFKLTGGSTVYSVTAKNIASEIGLHVARGTVDANIEVVADTVGNALDGTAPGINSLLQTMNNNMAKAKDAGNRTRADEYAVRFVGLGSDSIKDAELKSVADTDKKNSAPGPATNSVQVNDATGQSVAYDKQKIKISITQGMSVLQAIEKIIKQSKYMTNALDTLFMSEETPSDDTASAEKKEQKNPPTLRWYNVSPEVEALEYDTKINDFAYRITYVIQPYDTPAAVSPYGKSAKYYGPHKRYEYWYTGKNSEILSYEQQFDNAFFNITYNPNGDPAASGGDAKIAQLGGKKTGQDATGKLNPGQEAQNTYMTSLFDPGAYAAARIQILGDPDYLMRETASGVNEVYKQFYQSDGFTINPNGGQVFIEIAFNEGIDYGATVSGNDIQAGDNGTGVMTINDNIFFWDYPDSVKSGPNAIKGVSYQVRECESVFKGGKFTQTLQLNINEMPEAIEAAEKAASERATRAQPTTTGQGDVRTGNTQGGSTPTPGSNTNNSSANTGLAQDDATGVDAAVVAQAASNPITPQTGSTTTGSVPTNSDTNPTVADDDSVANSGSTTAGSSDLQNAGGREASNTNNTTPTDTRTGEASTATINLNAPGGV
jgi:hypothetical protein